MSVAPERAHAGTPLTETLQDASDARQLQHELLIDVSRTFALTIPRLPAALADVVGNAYLLCRIVDTIEDELHADSRVRHSLYQRFKQCLDDDSLRQPQVVRDFAADLTRLLPTAAPAGEARLVRHIPDVLNTTAGFSDEQRCAMRECIAVMTDGMQEFEGPGASGRGLEDTAMLSRYCYHVAGCVGELLTRLFCHHDEQIAARQHELMPLARAFGRGLQLTNILKDMWIDQRRGVCWLPRDVFCGAQASRDNGDSRATSETKLIALMQRAAEQDSVAIGQIELGTQQLVACCRQDLDHAMQYVHALPRQHRGLRVFCLWSIGLSVLTLRKIQRQSIAERLHGTKVSRASVKATLLLSDASAGYSPIMHALYRSACIGLPRTPKPM